MSDSNENEDLLKELEEVTCEPQGPASNTVSVLDHPSGLSSPSSPLASVKEEASANQSQEENVALESSVASSENALEQNLLTSNTDPDLIETTDDAADSTAPPVESVEIEKDGALSASSDTMSAAGSPNVPEIVPNSETHVSDIDAVNEDNFASMDSVESNEEDTGLVKEEMIEDVVETREENRSFSISPSFEANLDPKFKPTIRLEKIDVTSGSIKEEPDADEDTLSEAEEEANASGDEGSSSKRPRRSIKTPAHLAGSFVLNPKDANSKALQRASGVDTKPEKAIVSKIVKIVKDTFVPIRPKPQESNKELTKVKSATVSIVKSPSKTTQVTTPGADKQRSGSQEAKEIVRKLNADNKPSILKRTKRKTDEPEAGPNLAPPPKKEKVAPPPKKQQRKHRKVFDYESYLRDHLEAEVNDKKPKSATGSGAPFQVLSSVNVPPSKSTVLPRSGIKSSLRSAKENESNNIERTKERTLYDLMQDVSHMLPSWNLHVLPDSNSFCIAQICRGRSGIPTLKTSIELDPQFNAKVFIHQLHCKRYDGVYDSEESISALIQEIDGFSK